MRRPTRRHWASLAVAAGIAALMIAGLAGAGTAAQPEGAATEELSVAATCLQPQAPPPAGASADYYLKIDGVEGESTADRHAGEIDIESFTWGISQSSLLNCTTSARTAFQPILIVKRIDKSSPVLMQAVANGKHIARAVLSAERAGERPFTFSRITFGELVVAGYSLGVGPGALPVDQFSLSYATIKFEYIQQRPDGGAGKTTTFCWNVRANRPCPTT
jgi:type VI secretion system secreted protein Hcp